MVPGEPHISSNTALSRLPAIADASNAFDVLEPLERQWVNKIPVSPINNDPVP